MPLSATERHEQLARAYVEAHGLTAISVIAGPALQIEAFDAKAGRTPFDWKARRAGVWWCTDPATVRRLADSVGSATGVDNMERRLLLTAERAGVRLTDHATLLGRAKQAVELVESRLRAMQSSGDIRGLNAEYQDARLFAKERGRNVQPYWSWLHRRKIAMVEDVARAASGRRKPPADQVTGRRRSPSSAGRSSA